MKIEDEDETIGATFEHDDFVVFMTSTDVLDDQRRDGMSTSLFPLDGNPPTVFVADSHLNCSSKRFIA